MKLTWAMNLPEAWRLLRICWQPKRLAAVAILPLFVSLLIVAYMGAVNYEENKTGEQGFLERKQQCAVFYEKRNDSKGIELCGNRQFTPEPFPYALLCQIMLGLQGLLWVFAAPAAVGMSVHTEFDKDTWVLQQTTPQSSRKLLLGKILGAPGDIYVISALNLPFVLVSAAQAHIPLLSIAQIFLISLILFALLSSLISYVLFMTGKIKSAPGLLLGLFLLTNYGLAAGAFAAYNSHNDDNSYMRIHPIALYVNALNMGDKVDIEIYGSPKAPYGDYVRFFDENFTVFPFAVAFYLVIAAWFFIAADAELRRKTSMPSGRYYLFALFALAEFIFIGFTFKHVRLDDHFYQNSMATLYNTLVIFLAYFVIFSQVRTTGEMRPWIYRTADRGRKLQDYFSDDAPPLYSMVAILLIILCGIAATPIQIKNSGITPLSAQLINAGCLSIIILRDILFFQIAKMCHKRGLILGVLIYALIFIGVTGLTIVYNNGKPIFDLTPFSALASILILVEPGSAFSDNYITAYMIYNGALAVLFLIAHSLLISAARRKFKPAAAPAPAK